MSTLYNKIITQPENRMTKQAGMIAAGIRTLPRLFPRLISGVRTGIGRRALSPGNITNVALEFTSLPNTIRSIKNMWNGRGSFTSNAGNFFKSIAQDGLNNISPAGGGDLLFDKIPRWLRNWYK